MNMVTAEEVFVPRTVPSALRAKMARALGSLPAFAKTLQVQDKDSKKLIPFQALPMQTKIFAAVEGGAKRIVILKARQVAATTGCKVVLQWLATTTKNAAMHALVSMRDASATSLVAD